MDKVELRERNETPRHEGTKEERREGDAPFLLLEVIS
jgi:hypothetical protein